jgi:Protein of unknown function (DUF3606)
VELQFLAIYRRYRRGSWTPAQHRTSEMNRRKQAYFRNSVELRDKVEVRTLRKRLKLSPSAFKDVVRKAGSSISAI